MVTNLSLGPPLAQKQGIVLCAARASPQRAFEAGSSEHGDQKVSMAVAVHVGVGNCSLVQCLGEGYQFSVQGGVLPVNIR